MITGYTERIKTANINSTLESLVHPFLYRLARKNETVAVMKLGGLGRRDFSDVFSDVDISLFVEGIPDWLPQFEFYLPNCSAPGAFYEINVHQNTIDRERLRHWEDGKKEAYEEAILHYDPDNVARDLIQDKVLFNADRAKRRIQELLKAVSGFRPTGEFISDHLALNKILNQVIEIAYQANGEFQPHKKWRLEKARFLKNLPVGFDGLLEESIRVTEMSKTDVERRLTHLCELAAHYGNKETGTFNEAQANRHTPSAPSFDDLPRWLTLIAGQFRWFIDINPCRQVKRGFPLNSAVLLNEGMTMIVETMRFLKGEPIRQKLDVLDVIRPFPVYSECEYSLSPSFEAYPECKAPFIEAMITNSLSEETVEYRARLLRNCYTVLIRCMKDKKLIPQDPYHFAIENCYFDRQLKKTPYGEQICGEQICPPNLNDAEAKLLRGFVSYHLVGSEVELAEALSAPEDAVFDTVQMEKIRAMLSA